MEMRVLVAIAAGFSSLILLGLPELRRWQKQTIIREKLRMVTDALEQAEERLLRFQERHDRILYQLNSQYLSNVAMEEALAGARKAMDEALHFSVSLRRIQMKVVITSYPHGNIITPAGVYRQEQENE